jgi:hypothetical protein
MNKTVRIGANRGAHRLWLEGNWLIGFGFVKGAKFHAYIEDGRLVIRLGVSPAHRARTVSGKGDRPIIDIVGELLSPLAGKELTLTAKSGVMTVAETEV